MARYFSGFRNRFRRGYRRGYSRGYSRPRTVYINRGSYRRGGGSYRAWGMLRKQKNLVKILTLALILVGALAIFKPTLLKTIMQKVGLKTA